MTRDDRLALARRPTKNERKLSQEAVYAEILSAVIESVTQSYPQHGRNYRSKAALQFLRHCAGLKARSQERYAKGIQRLVDADTVFPTNVGSIIQSIRNHT